MQSYLKTIQQFDRNLRYFFTATAVHSFVFFGIYTLLLNLYLLRLNYGPSFIGLVNGVGPLVLAVASLPAGLISRRIGSRIALIIGYFFISVGFTLLPLSEYVSASYREGWIIGSYALAWLSGSLVTVNYSPYLMGATTAAGRNHAFAVQSGIFPVFGFIGNLVGGFLPGFFSHAAGVTLAAPLPYRNALLFAGAAYLLAAVAMWLTANPAITVAESVSTATSVPTTRSVPTTTSPTQNHAPAPIMFMVVIFVVTFLVVAGEWSLRIYYNVYLDSVFGVQTAVIGTISAIGQLLGMVALAAPLLMARFGTKHTLLYGYITLPIIFIPVILIAHWTAVGFSFIAMIAVLSLSNPAFGVFTQSNVAPEWRTMMASTISMAMGLGIAIMALGGGQIVSSSGFQRLFLLGAISIALGAALFWGYFFRTGDMPPLLAREKRVLT